MEDLMNAIEAADYLDVTERTLVYWRRVRHEPPWQRVRGRIRYRREDLDHWIQCHVASGTLLHTEGTTSGIVCARGLSELGLEFDWPTDDLGLGWSPFDPDRDV